MITIAAIYRASVRNSDIVLRAVNELVYNFNPNILDA